MDLDLLKVIFLFGGGDRPIKDDIVIYGGARLIKFDIVIWGWGQ